MKRMILTSAFLFIALSLISSNERYVYTQISQNEGLTSTVNHIYKEKDGDVWIGTPNGLFSFNGYSLKKYTAALPGCRGIHYVGKDSSNHLWVLTDRFIFRMDEGTDTFRQLSTKEDMFFCMIPVDSAAWIGGKGKIYKYEYSDDSLEVFCCLGEEFDCRLMGLVDQKTLLCCSHNGKKIIDIENGSISDAPYGGKKEVSSMLVDSSGHIWLASYNDGVEVYKRDGTLVRKYNTDNSGLSNDIVLCLAERASSVLAGTDGGGINIIDPSDHTVDVISHISGDRSSFPANSIKSLCVDHYGNIWAGSIRDGLICINRSNINSYTDTRLGMSDGLSNPTVLCLHQGADPGQIWIGTDGEGLNSFDPVTGKFRHFKNTFRTKVVSIADYSHDELVYSTYADDLWIFNKKNGGIRQLPLSNRNFRSWIRHSGRSVNLYNEADSDLLIFTNTIFRYSKSDCRCLPISFPEGKKTNSNILILGQNEKGIWLHNNFDIYLLEDDADILVHKGEHKEGMIRNGHLDENGIIWLATEEGLCRFDTVKEEFSHIKTSLFTDANSVVCDRLSQVWVGTEKGLSAYIIESGSFALFGESDGVVQNEYLMKPHLLSDDGDVYLGGVRGLLHIPQRHITDAAEEPLLKLSGLIVDGSPIQAKGGSPFKVPRYSKTMDIDVSVIEKDMFRQRGYRFYMSDEKVYETSIPLLSLQHLPGPGTYKVSVSCTRRNGEWTEPVELMTLKIPQPWYLTWWSILGFLSLVVIAFSYIIFTINRRKTHELDMALKDQEQKVYEEKVRMLINISHELRTPLTLIMAPLKRLINQTDQEKEDFPVLNRIYRQSKRMRSLLDMVLDLRKLEVGANGLKVEKVDFNAWISDTADDIVNEEKAEGIHILYDFDQRVGAACLDRQKCDIVLMNILINAIKHSSSGETITIKTSLTEEGMIRTSISDQGPGLGKDIDLDKMFSRFYQSNSESYGSGIGLSYSKILVQMHGGRIGVRNNPDRGATFWWDIPASLDEQPMDVEPRAYLNELLGHSSEAEMLKVSPENDFSTSAMRLMLVDDSTDLLDFLREALCQDFGEIITVTGGNPAIKALQEGKLPDIIVSDVNMPDGDGFSFCSELKKSGKYSHIPVILLTARGEDQSQSESYRLGADGFLAKPFEIETLMEMIRGLLRNKAEIRKRYLDTDQPSESGYGSDEEHFILKLNNIISEHLSDSDLDQQLICRELGVSRALLYNKMKAITGAGAKEYITRIRIEKAKSLIESTHLTIAEISDMTGFASQSYFSTAFKNYTGMTPSQYKQKIKAEK